MTKSFSSFKEEVGFFSSSLYRFLWSLLFYLFSLSWLIVAFLLLFSRGFYLGLFLFLLFFVNLYYYLSGKKKLSSSLSEKVEKEETNYLDYFSLKSKRFLLKALLLASKTKKDIGLFLLQTITQEKDIQKLFQELDIKKEKLKREISLLENLEIEESSKEDNIKKAFFLAKNAILAGIETNSQTVEPYHLLLSLNKERGPFLKRLLLHLGLSDQDITLAGHLISLEKKTKRPFFFVLPQGKISHRIMNRSWTARATPLLDSFSLDLTDLAREEKIGFLVGHQEEMKRLINVLAKDFKNNALLVGFEGAGKESLVNHLSHQIAKDDVPAKLFDKRVVKLNLSNLASGLESPGEIRERGKKVFEEIVKSKNIILFLPEINQLFEEEDVSFIKNIILPYLRSSSFQIVASISPDALSRFETKEREFLNNFEQIKVKEISPEDALRVLTFFSFYLEKKYKIEISLKSLKRAVELAKIYSPGKLLPSSAIELIDEATKELLNRKENYLQTKLINEIVERKTKVPLKTLTEKEREKFLKLEEEIHQSYIDQEEAVKAVARVLRTYRAGLKEKNKPIASLLFVGPTGVGKTYLTKILTKILFGKEDLMIRFDMSKFQTKFSLWKFIGSPQGEEGELTRAIKNRPYNVLLLDEFEKCSKEIQNLFLPILDEGRIKDNCGNILDFSHSLIVATSNAHSLFLIKEMRKNRPFPEIALELKNLLVEDFPPELLNRFSEIAVFRPLKPEEIEKITSLNLENLKKNILEKYHWHLSFSQSAIKLLAQKGYSEEFGVRPLKYVIKKEIRGLLSKKVLEKKWLPGTKFYIDCQNNTFVINEFSD